MATLFYVLSLDTPFPIVKGFVQGFMQGRGSSFTYFFPRKGGIKKETFGDVFKEYLSLHCSTQICIPENVLREFKLAVNQSQESIGIHIEAVKKIESAYFRFHFHIYTEEFAHNMKSIMKKIPAGVKVEQYEPVESRNEAIVGVHEAIYEYSPVSSYAYEGSGNIIGEFEGVLDMYLRIKKSPVTENILCSDLHLELEEN